jgi:hypothetical protein
VNRLLLACLALGIASAGCSKRQPAENAEESATVEAVRPAMPENHDVYVVQTMAAELERLKDDATEKGQERRARVEAVLKARVDDCLGQDLSAEDRKAVEAIKRRL